VGQLPQVNVTIPEGEVSYVKWIIRRRLTRSRPIILFLSTAAPPSTSSEWRVTIFNMELTVQARAQATRLAALIETRSRSVEPIVEAPARSHHR
jgi:hypothetical protein